MAPMVAQVDMKGEPKGAGMAVEAYKVAVAAPAVTAAAMVGVVTAAAMAAMAPCDAQH